MGLRPTRQISAAGRPVSIDWRYVRRYLPCYWFVRHYHMGDVKHGQRFAFMTLEQVAERTGRSVAVLQKWARQGRIPAERVGRMWIVAESDLPAIEAMPRTPGRQPADDRRIVVYVGGPMDGMREIQAPDWREVDSYRMEDGRYVLAERRGRERHYTWHEVPEAE